MSKKTILVIGDAKRKHYQSLRDEIILQGDEPIIFRITADKFNFIDEYDDELPHQFVDEHTLGHQEGCDEYFVEVNSLVEAMGGIHAIVIDQEIWENVNDESFGAYLLLTINFRNLYYLIVQDHAVYLRSGSELVLQENA